MNSKTQRELKGFAVVAEAIRELAENSKETANNIQTINTTVHKCVEELAENSMAMIEFVNKDIINDYDRYVETAQQYREDAFRYQEVMETFATNTNSLDKVLEGMMKQMEQVSDTIEENSQGINTVAQGTSGIAEGILVFESTIEKNVQLSNRLKTETSLFEKV